MKLISGLVGAVLLTLAVPVCAQSLGDLAKQEAERRKAAPPAAKTYTNEDLKKLPPMAAEVGSKEAPTKVADDQKPADAAKPGRREPRRRTASPRRTRSSGARRITAAREEVRRNEMFRDALQTRINALTADFANRDDPFQRAQIGDDRQKAIAELARVNLEIDKANKAIGDIEEEARRAGVPPGWLR